MAEATDRLGGNVDAFTGKETACFYGKVLREQLPALVDLLGELVTTPRFEEDELARERQVILEEISQSEDQPDDWVSELFYANFWPGGTLAHPILGTREQVAGYGAGRGPGLLPEDLPGAQPAHRRRGGHPARALPGPAAADPGPAAPGPGEPGAARARTGPDLPAQHAPQGPAAGQPGHGLPGLRPHHTRTGRR